MNERLEAIVSGRVQMVMYRDFACRKARGLGLVGEVKNLSDGTVRVIAEGPRTKLEDFCTRLHRGSIFSNVEQVTCAWGLATREYDSFEISYDR
jgi:acylphosphatase